MKKLFLVLLIVLTITGFYGLGQSVQASADPGHILSARADKIDPALQKTLNALQPGEMASVIVTLKAQADLSRIGGPDRGARLKGVIRALQAMAEASQRSIKTLIDTRMAQGLVSQVTYFWVFDGLSITATAEVIQELAARPDVLRITPDEIAIQPDAVQSAGASEPNLSVVNAPALWNLGLYGQSVVVANLDSGVDVSHPDLATRWRGGSNSWYDPYGQHPTTPSDLSGHGTWTMGVMVGGDTSGTSIGLAPAAQWIAVKIFNDAGLSTATAIHQGFQWLLDPDGNVNTIDAPNVVNNSWTFANPGCNLEFQLDLVSLRAAGILPVFAAGNGGPSGGSSYSPSNYPEAFAVGATDNNDGIYASSSRGPSACGESTTIYPEVVAPGINIRTSDLYSLYTHQTGTSLAAPHLAGGLAQLLGAYPNLSADQQASALVNSAVDLGAVGADIDFGFGRLDLLSAYQWLLNPPTPTPTSVPPTPTPTATPDPTINLALNKPVTVSSIQDSAHAGSMAVDGNLTSFWKTLKASGKNKLPSEWIVIDLGNSLSVGRVVLEWDANYATSYSLQISNDNSTWTQMFTTSTGDGASDVITFNATTARYIKLDTTSWSNSSLRVWLRELQVFAAGGSTPTATPVPTPTATPMPSPTATPGGSNALHIGDLDGSSSPGSRNRWNASVIVLVHDASHLPVANATVSGNWSNGASGNASCLTNANGSCTVTTNNLRNSSATFSVTSISFSGLTYNATANHDPDGDSNGTSITVLRP